FQLVAVGAPVDLDDDVTCARVAHDVRDAFLHDAEHADLDDGCEPLRQAGILEHPRRAVLETLCQQLLDRHFQPEEVEAGRAQRHRQVAYHADQGRHLTFRRAPQGHALGVVEPWLAAVQQQVQRGHPLAELVVQLARQRLALRFLRIDEGEGQVGHADLFRFQPLDQPGPLDGEAQRLRQPSETGLQHVVDGAGIERVAQRRLVGVGGQHDQRRGQRRALQDRQRGQHAELRQVEVGQDQVPRFGQRGAKPGLVRYTLQRVPYAVALQAVSQQFHVETRFIDEQQV
ncbi:conserved hypothetical protein, partial [Ricinus communis]